MTDTYEAVEYRTAAHPSKKVFSFLNHSTKHPQPEHGSNFSLFPSVANANARGRPTSRPPQYQQRIFPPANFSTPQRPRAKIESISPSATNFQEFTSTRAIASESILQEQTDQKMHSSKSPQYRYMPTPKTCERASSRASSETPFLVTDADPDNLDLSEIMHRKLTEAKANKNQLAEERVISANLRSQLTTVKATCDEQKRHIVELEVAAQSNLENSHLKDRQLSELQLMFDETLSAKESQLEMNTDKDEQIRVGQEKLRCAEEKIRATEDRVTKVKDAAKRGIENMSKNFDALRNAVEHLKTRYEVSVETISKMRDELEAIRLATSNGIKDLEPFMDPSGLHLVKANETRMLIQELQTDRNDAQQVIDFLKDKLHNLSTQLAEANENTVDLENRRREDSNNLARSVNSWETTGRQVEELASKLRQREKEDAELLAEGLKLEIQLSDANDKIGDLSQRLDQRESVIEGLVKEKQTLVDELKDKSKSLEVVNERLLDGTEECLSYRQRVQTKETEVALLSEKLRVSEETKGDLQAIVRKNAAEISELEASVKLRKAGETSSNAKISEALDRIKSLEAEKAQVQRSCDAIEQDLRRRITEAVVLQERFDSQAITLKLAKDHSGDLQERLSLCETAQAVKLESTHGQYKKELAVLEEQKNNLHNVVGRLQDDVCKLESTIDKLRTDNAAVQIQLESTHGKYKTDLRVLGEQKSSLQNVIGQQQEDICKLESTVDKLRAANAAAGLQQNELQIELDTLRQNASNLESSSEKLRIQNSSLAEERTNLQSSLDRYRHDSSKLKSDVDIRISEISSLRERVGSLQEQNSDLARLKEERTLLQSTLTKKELENAVLYSEKTSLQKRLEKLLDDLAQLRQTMEKNRTELSEMLEQRLLLHTTIEGLQEDMKLQMQARDEASKEYQANLIKQEEATERLLSAVTKRAETAEQGLGELTRELTSRIASMEIQLETVNVASGSSGKQKGDVADAKIGQLEGVIQRLREREQNLEKRYHEGDLNDAEKRFVNSLMKFSKDVHEKVLVAKENELRRRDNMVTTLQQKVVKLESTLAKFLKDKGKGNNFIVPALKEKSMLDLNMWMSSPLTDFNAPILAANATNATDIDSTLPLAFSQPPEISLPPVPPTQGARPSRSPKTPTFAKLEEDISDFDDIPLTKLGKRNRPASPSNKATQDTSARPARRGRFASRKGGESHDQTQMGEKKKAENTKVKSRKRP